MIPQISSLAIVSHTMSWRGGVVYPLPWDFRRRMRLGVAAVAMMSLVYCGDADADNVTENPPVLNNCGTNHGLHESTEWTNVMSGAGAGSMTLTMNGFGTIDGCFGSGIGWSTDIFHIGLNGAELFNGCMLARKNNPGVVFLNTNGATWSYAGGARVTITIPLTFVNGPNVIGSWWTGDYDGGKGGESYCIESLSVNHPPKITPPPPLLTATPAPGSPSGPGSTVPPESGTPAPLPLVCGEVGGNTPMPVCVEGNCSAPTGFRYKCSTTYDVLTFTWDASAGAKGYNLRLNFKGNDSPTCKDGWYCPGSADENIIGTANTSYSFDVIPGAEYKAWIQYVGSDGKESGMQIFDPIVCKAP